VLSKTAALFIAATGSFKLVFSTAETVADCPEIEAQMTAPAHKVPSPTIVRAIALLCLVLAIQFPPNSLVVFHSKTGLLRFN
jgi:hypothetical protein